MTIIAQKTLKLILSCLALCGDFYILLVFAVDVFFSVENHSEIQENVKRFKVPRYVSEKKPQAYFDVGTEHKMSRERRFVPFHATFQLFFPT